MLKSHFSNEVKVLHLYAKVAVGSSGAPTLDTAASKGIASITRTSQGLYQLTLDRVYNSVLMVNIMTLDGTLQDITYQVKAETLTSKTIDFWAKTGATATDPQSGATMRIQVIVKDSSV